jgi:hypothetical protein
MMIDESDLDDVIIPRLVNAIVLRAVEDWRELCGGEKETRSMNFVELEKFFASDCAGYIQDHSVAVRIFKRMLAERKKALGY